MNFTAVAKGLAGWRGYALVGALCFAAGGFSAGKITGLYYGATIAAMEKSYSDNAAKQAFAALDETIRLSAEINTIDTTGFRELADAKAENEKLRADIRAGTLRLSVRTDRTVGGLSGSSSASGLGDAARTELDREDADNLLAITGDGDQAIVKLNTCIKAYDAARATALATRGN